ncbi:hypothetical protein BJX96DRAFT_177005 [Aspergillus floccosus]
MGALHGAVHLQLILAENDGERQVPVLFKSRLHSGVVQKNRKKVDSTNRELSQVFSLSARLIVSDPGVVLRPLLASWQENVARGAHALGLPLQRKGVNAAGAYARFLKDDAGRDGVAQRVARMWLVLNYRDICKQTDVYCPWPFKGKPVAHVIDCIARAALEDTSKNPSQRDRDAILHFLMQGKWLWTLISQVGMGLVLACSVELMSAINNANICNAAVDAVAAHAASSRPGLVRLLSSLKPVVMALMSGVLHGSFTTAAWARGESETINVEPTVRPRRKNIGLPNVWGSIFKSEKWLNAIIVNHGANPVLIGPNLDEIGLPPHQRKAKIIFALLHTADLSGDVRYATSDQCCRKQSEDTLFFRSLRDGYKYNRLERKITFADIGVILNICEPIENLEILPLWKDLKELVEGDGEKVQSQYSFFAEEKIKIVKSPEIIGIGGPILTTSDIGPVLALNLDCLKERLQFIFQETEDCGWSVDTMEDGMNYANHSTVVSAFRLKT